MWDLHSLFIQMHSNFLKICYFKSWNLSRNYLAPNKRQDTTISLLFPSIINIFPYQITIFKGLEPFSCIQIRSRFMVTRIRNFLMVWCRSAELTPPVLPVNNPHLPAQNPGKSPAFSNRCYNFKSSFIHSCTFPSLDQTGYFVMSFLGGINHV